MPQQQKKGATVAPEAVAAAASPKNGRYLAALLAFLAYTLCYLLRKSMSASSVHLKEDLGFTETAIGAIGSSYAIGYGFSKLPGGIVSDFFQPRSLLSLALILCAILTTLTATLNHVHAMTIVWSLHGFVQGFTWSPCGRIVNDFFSKSERALWWSIVSSSQNVGAALTPVIIDFFQSRNMPTPLPVYPQAEADTTWRLGLLAIAATAAMLAVIIYFYLPDTPVGARGESSKPKRDKGREAGKGSSSPEQQQSAIARILASVSKVPAAVALIVASNMFIYIFRDAIGNWSILLLRETKGFGSSSIASANAAFEVSGLVGGLLAGIISDKVFDSRRGPLFVLSAAGLALATFMLKFVSTETELTAVMGLMGLFLFGPQTLAGLFAMELAPRNISGFCGSTVALFSQLGASVAGYPLSLLVEAHGFAIIYDVLPLVPVIIGVLSIPLWNAQPKEDEKDKDE